MNAIHRCNLLYAREGHDDSTLLLSSLLPPVGMPCIRPLTLLLLLLWRNGVSAQAAKQRTSRLHHALLHDVPAKTSQQIILVPPDSALVTRLQRLHVIKSLSFGSSTYRRTTSRPSPSFSKTCQQAITIARRRKGWSLGHHAAGDGASRDRRLVPDCEHYNTAPAMP